MEFNEPVKCPKCGSDKIVILDDENDGEDYTVRWLCRDCEFKWEIEYELKFTYGYYYDDEGECVFLDGEPYRYRY